MEKLHARDISLETGAQIRLIKREKPGKYILTIDAQSVYMSLTLTAAELGYIATAVREMEAEADAPKPIAGAQ